MPEDEIQQDEPKGKTLSFAKALGKHIIDPEASYRTYERNQHQQDPVAWFANYLGPNKKFKKGMMLVHPGWPAFSKTFYIETIMRRVILKTINMSAIGNPLEVIESFMVKE